MSLQDFEQAGRSLVERFGESLTLESTSAGTYSATTRSYTGETTTTTTLRGAPVPYTTREIDGTTIVAGDVRFIIAGTPAPSTVPAEGHIIVWNSVRYRVLGTMPMAVGGQIAAYEVHARGVE